MADKRGASLLVLFAIAGLIGLGAFGLLAWRAVTIGQMDPQDATQRFTDALADIESRTPLVALDASGRFVRRASSPTGGARPARLYVLAYRAPEQRFVSADVPLWFYKVKGPAVRYALGETNFDLQAPGLTATDLEQAGAGVVLDETRANGDRVLAWTR